MTLSRVQCPCNPNCNPHVGRAPAVSWRRLVLAVTRNSRQAANNFMITGSDGGRGADLQVP
jgi:hypothetical protein